MEFRASFRSKPHISSVAVQGFEGMWARPPCPAWSSGAQSCRDCPSAVQDAFVSLKSTRAFILRWREDGSIFFSMKGNAVISNLRARSL